MDVEVNLAAVVAATVLAMVIGGIWYSELAFGKAWKKLAKVDEKKAKDGATKALAGMALGSLVMAYVLAHVTYLSSSFFNDYTFQGAALSSAFWMWFGFILPINTSDSLFNQRPWKLTAIQSGNWLVTLLGMALVIGSIGL